MEIIDFFNTCGGIIGTLLGTGLGFFLGLTQFKYIEKRNKAREIRRIFIELKNMLDLHDEDTYKILNSTYDKQIIEIEDYISFVGRGKAKKIRKAFDIYLNKDYNDAFYFQNYADNGSHTKRQELKELAKKRIDAIIDLL